MGMADVVCPLIKTTGSVSEAAATSAAASAEPTTAGPMGSSITDAITGQESVVDQSSGGSSEEGYFQFKNLRIYGFRTYSVILIIVLVFSYLCIKNNDIQNYLQLALMAVSFLFGMKASNNTRGK
jgi:hypothetical protein